MPFKPPKTSSFKQFVILDSDGVVAALSALDGGQIDEILTRTAEERGGEGNAELRIGPGKAGGRRGRSRKVEEEIRSARTRHAAAAKLLESLEARDALGEVDGPLDMEVAEQVSAGMVLRFRAELRLHPLHHADQMLRSYLKIAPKFGEKQSVTELKQVLNVWGAVVGTDEADSRLLIQPMTSEPQNPRLLLPVPRDHFEVDVADVLGEVTVVAQVERVLTVDENFPAIRFLRGSPASGIERSALEGALPGLVEGIAELGVPIAEEDLFVPGPALLLRAICAYR